MTAEVPLYTGSAIVFFWGVAHILPTKSVVAGFEPHVFQCELLPHETAGGVVVVDADFRPCNAEILGRLVEEAESALLLVTHNREMASFTHRQFRLFEGRLHTQEPVG